MPTVIEKPSVKAELDSLTYKYAGSVMGLTDFIEESSMITLEQLKARLIELRNEYQRDFAKAKEPKTALAPPRLEIRPDWWNDPGELDRRYQQSQQDRAGVNNPDYSE